jgi:16S rRNA (guanine527-N7)-methyltransferase
MTDAPPPLHRVLRRARELRFLGPAPLEDQIGNGLVFAEAVSALHGPAAAVADLGPGGGVPSLVIADRCPDVSMVLIERARRRVDFLRWAVAELGWQDRIRVHLGEAEDAGRDPALAESFDVVTARSFGPAAVTAECGCRLLRPGGHLVVSEPPGAPDRWPSEALRPLGLMPATLLGDGPARLAVLMRDEKIEPEAVYPRRAGVPRRRPLF